MCLYTDMQPSVLNMVVSDQVIDISASYLYETESDRWFLPAFSLVCKNPPAGSSTNLSYLLT